MDAADVERGRGIFYKLRGKGVDPAATTAPSRGAELAAAVTRTPAPGADNPYDAAVANSIATNPWGVQEPSGTRSQNVYGQRGSGW
jgi:hypothetical protein